MSNDIYVSYIKKPDNTFFVMKGRRDFAIENGQLIPPDVEEYFADDEACTEGIKIQIPTKRHYDDTDYFTVKFDVVDIPDEAATIIVGYG